MDEKNLLNKLMLTAPDNEILFRNNVGTGWVGEVVKKGQDFIVLRDPRVLHAGLCVGSSDLIGWRSVEITPEMVGKKVAVFVAIEAKTGKVRVTPDQENFIARVKDAGGIGEIIRE